MPCAQGWLFKVWRFSAACEGSPFRQQPNSVQAWRKMRANPAPNSRRSTATFKPLLFINLSASCENGLESQI